MQNMVESSNSHTNPCHPIQVVSHRTGLSNDVIRVWERRYQAVQPSRSTSGRRIYSDADIERLLALKQATDGGRRIGDVASLPVSELRELVATDEDIRKSAGLTPDADRSLVAAGNFLGRCLEAVDALNPIELSAMLSQAAVAMPIPQLLDELVAPFLTDLGERWRCGDFRVGQEHMASAAIRTFLDNLRLSANMSADGPIILVTTPSGQNHELGALMAAVAAASAGWNTLYLNPNLPAQDIAATAIQINARAVALSLTYPADDSRIASELRMLHSQLPPGTNIIVGGRSMAAYQDILKEIEAFQLSRFAEMQETLDRLRYQASV